MNRSIKANVMLVAFALVGLTFQTAKADLHFNTSHQSFFAFDGTSLAVDVYDTVTADAAGDTRNPATVGVLGSPASFLWEGSGSLAVTNVTSGSATLTMSSMTPVGNSHYSYISNSGDGLFTSSTTSGTTVFNLNGSPNELAQNGADYTISFALSGNYVPTEFSIAPGYTVTNYFTYDPTFDATLFSAQTTFSGTSPQLRVGLTSVPEPGIVALLTGVSFGSLALLRRRRK